jgi:hypothetical protein
MRAAAAATPAVFGIWKFRVSNALLANIASSFLLKQASMPAKQQQQESSVSKSLVLRNMGMVMHSPAAAGAEKKLKLNVFLLHSRYCSH